MDSSTGKNSAGGTCEFQQNLEILRQTQFFAGLPMETLKVFAYLCTRESFAAQDCLYDKDDDDGQAFYILSGQLVLVHDTDGGEAVIRDFGPGDFIGGLALLAPMRRLFALKAGQATDCLVLSREKFAKAIGQFPELIPRVFKSMADSIRDWDQQRLFEATEKGLSLKDMVGISAI